MVIGKFEVGFCKGYEYGIVKVILFNEVKVLNGIGLISNGNKWVSIIVYYCLIWFVVDYYIIIIDGRKRIFNEKGVVWSKVKYNCIERCNSISVVNSLL